jgi:ABC-2 type transport system permease protein
MSVVSQEIIIYTKLFFRERIAVFWGFVFPILLLILFCSIFGGTPERSTALVSGLICINTISGTLYGLGVVTVGAREQGILRRYKVAPVALWKIVTGLCISRLISVTLTTMFLIIVARVFYDILLPARLVPMAVAFACGTLMFCAIAFAVAAISRSVAQANGLTQVLFVPMMFLSGATFPYEFMPGWMQRIAHVLPSTYYVSGLKSTMLGATGVLDNIDNFILMAVFTAFAIAVSVRFFRWE